MENNSSQIFNNSDLVSYKCNKCNTEKPVCEYRKDVRIKRGHDNTCIECR